MSRPGPLVWGEGAEQLNKYLKDLREGNWTSTSSCDTVFLLTRF
jgi:hypothetical protein